MVHPSLCVTHLFVVARSETEAILAKSGIEGRPFSKGALAELPAIIDPLAWQIPASEIGRRRDLRGPEYLVCSIDPPGRSTPPVLR
jgi:exoribonuclease R